MTNENAGRSRRKVKLNKRKKIVKRPWSHYLAEALLYPVRGASKWISLCYGPLYFFVLFVFLKFIGIGFVGTFGEIARYLLYLFGQGICVVFFLAVIKVSSETPDPYPFMPKFEAWWDNLVRPLFLVFLLFAGPALLLVAVRSLSDLVPEPLFLTLLLLVIITVVFYWPLSLLCASVTDSFAALDPSKVLRSLPAIMPVYLITALIVNCIALLAVLFGPFSIIETNDLSDLGGQFLVGIIGSIAFLYLETVIARILGTFYYCYSDEFKW